MYRNFPKCWIIPLCQILIALACVCRRPSLINEGCCCQYSQRRNWSQSAAESWTWAPAVLDHPAACTALANSPPWTGLQQTCSFLPNETRPVAEADRLQGPGFWERREDGYFWTVPVRPAVSQAKWCLEYRVHTVKWNEGVATVCSFQYQYQFIFPINYLLMFWMEQNDKCPSQHCLCCFWNFRFRILNNFIGNQTQHPLCFRHLINLLTAKLLTFFSALQFTLFTSYLKPPETSSCIQQISPVVDSSSLSMFK